MNQQTPISDKSSLQSPPDFSLVLGGPLYQLLRRSHLTDDALTHLKKRIVFISLFCWLPLLLLTALEGKLIGGSVAVPFLWDFDIHIRFLASVPLLIVAELVVHKRMLPITKQFLDRQLIPIHAVEQFNAAVESASRLRNSVLAEVLLIAFVYTVGILFVWPQYGALDTATWYATLTAAGSNLTLAGKWFVFVSLPFFQFLMLRWYFRVFMWARFLWHVSRIELNLLPTHPDGAAGLGFLGNTAVAFAPVLMAHGALVAGMVANRIFYRSATLPEFYMMTAVLVVFLLCLVFGPLLVFAPQLQRAKLKGAREYGILASRYVSEFDTKWLRGGAPADEQLIGSGDIQSLADLGNSYQVVRTMSVVPFSKSSVVQLAVMTVAPLVPLALTMMPLEELLKKLLGLVL
jgi:hypothetical protein